jgi:hypothetical protein
LVEEWLLAVTDACRGVSVLRADDDVGCTGAAGCRKPSPMSASVAGAQPVPSGRFAVHASCRNEAAQAPYASDALTLASETLSVTHAAAAVGDATADRARTIVSLMPPVTVTSEPRGASPALALNDGGSAAHAASAVDSASRAAACATAATNSPTPGCAVSSSDDTAQLTLV